MIKLKEDALREIYSEMKPFSLGLMSREVTTVHYDIWDLCESMRMQPLVIQNRKPLSDEAIDTWYDLINELVEIQEYLEDLEALIDEIGYSGDDK